MPIPLAALQPAWVLAITFLDARKASFDTQVNYDTSLGPYDTKWLDLIELADSSPG